MPKMDFAGDICLRRPRPILGCRGDDDDYDDDENLSFIILQIIHKLTISLEPRTTTSVKTREI
jgi:hypothetical protein